MGKPLPFRLSPARGGGDGQNLPAEAVSPFVLIPADIDEPRQAAYGDCRQYVHEVAWLKAAATAKKVTDGLILTADTVGWFRGEVIGKPDDADDARRILRRLGGPGPQLLTRCTPWERAAGWPPSVAEGNGGVVKAFQQ